MSGDFASPYLGLESFGEQDSPFFFGRDQAAEDVLRRLTEVLRHPAPLIISGVSGSGKSSLIRAGILPWMGEAGLASEPGVPPWPHLTLTATRAPLAELATGVAARAGSDAAALRASLAEDPSSIALAVRQATLRTAPDNPGRLLLIVDQFEQVFTQCPDEAERRAFIAALHAAATTGHGAEQTPAAVVVLAVRADFEARCAEYDELADAVQNRYLLRPMTERQLRLAITEPAKMLGSSVDDDLVERLTEETVSAGGAAGAVGAGVLPHLSHVLDQAWRHRAGDTVTLADYDRTGGIEGSIATSAEEAYAELTPDQQQAAQSVFMRLVTTSSDLVVSAGRATMPELTGAGDAGNVTAVVEAFAARRLLTVGEDAVEISHEVLLTAWERLRHWLDGDKIDMARYTRLTADARAWDSAGRPSGYLYPPGRLEEVSAAERRWTAAPNRYPPLTAVPAAFLRAARGAARRARQVRRGVIAVLSALTLAAATAAVIANLQHAAAVTQQQIALSRQLAAQSLTIPALPTAEQIAAAAWHISPTSQAASAMSTLLAKQDQNGELPAAPPSSANAGDDRVAAMAFNPNGTLLATSDGDDVRLWNPATGKPVGQPLTIGGGINRVESMAFSPDGKFFAAADSGKVKIWNTATGTSADAIGQFGIASAASSLAFDPAGALLAVSGNGGVQLRSVPGFRIIRTVKSSHPLNTQNGIAFNHDGTLLATIQEGKGISDSVGIWRTTTGRPVSTISSPKLGISGIAFSPEGNLLATADMDGYARLWNAATGAPSGKPIPVTSDFSSVNDVAFSPDGSMLASADDDGHVKLWNATTGALVGHPLADDPNSGSAESVAFSPQRGLLASGDADGAVHLWNVAAGSPVGATLQAAQSGNASGVASFSDQASFLGPNSDGYAGEWPSAAAGGKSEPPNEDPGNRVDLFGDPPITFSADGKMYAEATQGGINYGNVYPRTGRFLPAAPGASNQIARIEFSPDDRLLATSTGKQDGNYLMIWNTATGRLARKLLATSGRNTFLADWAFSPDHQLLATASCRTVPGSPDCAVTYWNPTTGTHVAGPFPVESKSNAGAMDFSPGDKLLAVSNGGAIDLLNPTTGKLAGTLPAVNPTADGSVEVVQFSPDGRILSAMYDNGEVQLWNPATKTPIGGLLGSSAESSNGTLATAYSSNSELLLSVNESGDVTDATPYPLWQFANPYAAVCDEAGPPPKSVWDQYASSTPEPAGICAGVPAASKLSG